MNTEKMQLWLNELETTSIPQTTGIIGNKEIGMCCLGVLDDVAYGGYTRVTKGSSAQIPSMGELDDVGLTRELTEMEVFAIKTLFTPLADPYDDTDWGRGIGRYKVLAMMNDKLGFTFQQIATMVKHFGWDKE